MVTEALELWFEDAPVPITSTVALGAEPHPLQIRRHDFVEDTLIVANHDKLAGGVGRSWVIRLT